MLCEFQNERIILKNFLLLFFLNKQLKICAFVGCHLPMLVAANRTAASEAKQKLTEKKNVYLYEKETKIFA